MRWALPISYETAQAFLVLHADSNVLSLTPPFCIDDDEIAFVAARLQEYLTALPGSIS